jgi:hypothetical protein
MAEGESKPTEASSVSDRFPALKTLEEAAERAKLEQVRDKAEAASDKAKLPSLDVEFTRDTIAVGAKTTGLARVLVQQDAVALADDMAEMALDAARDHTTGADGAFDFRIRVVSDPDALGDLDVYRRLSESAVRLVRRIDAYAPEPPEPSEPPPGEGEARAEIAPVAIAGAAIQAAGLASKLFARDFQLSGREVPVDGLGFDLLVANWLRRKTKPDETVRVDVDRVMPTPASQIATDVTALAEAADMRLVPVATLAAARAAELTAQSKMLRASLTALDAQILELVKRVPATPADDGDDAAARPIDVSALLAETNEHRTQLMDELMLQQGTLSRAQQAQALGETLLRDVQDFLEAAFTPGTDGRAAIVKAARGESLTAAGGTTHVLYARLIAGGLDQTVETKLVGKDRWEALVGVTAEYAVVTAEGRMISSNVFSVLQSSRRELGDPDSFAQHHVNYAGLSRGQRG